MKRVAITLAVLAAVSAIGLRLLPAKEKPAPRVEQRAVEAVDPFDTDGKVAAGPYRAGFSPDGAHMAVLDGRGVAMAEGGRLRRIEPPDGGVVDFAFLPGSDHVLLGQGPEIVRRLLLFGVDGSATGHVPLDPPLSLGSGHGMTVDATGRTAIVTASVRPPLGEEHLHLVVVDLREGTTRSLTPADGPDESRPVFAGDKVVYTSTDDGVSSVQLLDRATGASEQLSPKGRSSALAAVGEGHVLYVTEAAPPVNGRSEPRSIWVRPLGGGDQHLVGVLQETESIVTADLANGLLVVAERGQATVLKARRVPSRLLRPGR
ncbi:MAG TPA: hypothetical protein VM030_09515 [Acidimicrobiales bacterium]|nr:hypothetical protein [Acidimicrobiales bacterium]